MTVWLEYNHLSVFALCCLSGGVLFMFGYYTGKAVESMGPKSKKTKKVPLRVVPPPPPTKK